MHYNTPARKLSFVERKAAVLAPNSGIKTGLLLLETRTGGRYFMELIIALIFTFAIIVAITDRKK